MDRACPSQQDYVISGHHAQGDRAFRAEGVEVVQEKMKRMGPAEREKYQAKKDKLERERRARRMGKTMFK